MVEYAPGAPAWVKRYPAKVIGPAKVTLWDLWSRARHEDQRGCESAIVFVKPEPGEEGSPAEIFRRHVARETGQTESRVVAHLTKLRSINLVSTHGLAATLSWSPFDGGSGNPDRLSGNPDEDRENPTKRDRENRVKLSGKPDHGSGKRESLSGKSGAPIKSPSPPVTSPSPEQPQVSFALDVQEAEPPPVVCATDAQITAWWDEVFTPERAGALSDVGRGSRPVECTPKHRAAIRERLSECCPGLPWVEHAERLTHVVRNAGARVREFKGEKTSWGWQSKNAIAPKHWLYVEKNFEGYYADSPNYDESIPAGEVPKVLAPADDDPFAGLQAHEIEDLVSRNPEILR